MNKKLSLVLALVLIIGCFAGCGSKQSADGDVPTLLWYVNGEQQPDTPQVMEEVNKILVPKIGAKLNIQFIDDGAFTEKLQLAMAAGEDFDLCFTGYVNPYPTAVQRGGYANLDEYLEKYPKLKDAISQYGWDSVKVDGSIYAVPNTQTWGYAITAYTFKDLADKYGLNPDEVKTYKDLEPYLEQIKQNEPDMYPTRGGLITDIFNAPYRREQLVNGIMAVYGEDGSVEIESKVELDFIKESQEELHRWYKAGYLRKDIASAGDDTQDANAGKYGIWYGTYIPGEEVRLSDKYKREVIAIQLEEYFQNATYPHATMTAVNAKSKNIEKAVQLLELMNTDKELYNLISFGIEGKHYDKLEGDYIKLIDNSGYNPNAAWKFGNTFNAYLMEGQEPDQWEKCKEINENAEVY
ncbi:MAG: extracellular solute-binding protein, partial [Clostridia bacterium]|nr:extracellular solute-binding protein [Clostridia bacterium]